MTLNAVIALICVFSPNSIDFGADFITVVEDRPIILMSVKYCFPVTVFSWPKLYKMLSCRRETALQGALQFSPKVEEWNWETIFYGHYRSIFNYCDIIGLKICRIP